MARSTILAGLALVAAACGSRSDLDLPSTTTDACAAQATAARACTALRFGVAPTPIDLTATGLSITVFRVYDGSYTRIAEREVVSASFGGAASGHPAGRR